ncbi:Bifunctional purine biosynthesis protein PurH [subsurface metagenome]
MRALVSVSDKTGVVDFARGLHQLGVEIYSTGGTKKALEDAGVPVHSVGELTNFPEILDGRVKTLHPGVHAGILARRDVPGHLSQLAEKGLVAIDLVAVNLYPFVQTIAKEGTTLEQALENIDIGGPTMIRSAAKNFPHVIVIVEPADYQPVLEKLRTGEIGIEERKKLAEKAFQHVASYDTAIASYLRPEGEKFPPEMTIALRKLQDLSYGENPHQEAAFYIEEAVAKEPGITRATQLSGRELSFNNILDLDAAVSVVQDFSPPTIAIIKHNNPCGLSCHEDLAQAYRQALAGDPVSAFGGIVASNRPLDLAAAQEIDKSHFDAIIAPGYDDDALKLLKRKRDLRLIELGAAAKQAPHALDFRRVGGGFLLQTQDFIAEDVSLRPVTRRQPTPEEERDLLFAWRVAMHVKSNAIVLVKDLALLGMGAGQPSRVDSVEIALKKAGERARGSVLASDAFFPFPDGVELAAKGGATALIQPGGSMRDEEVIAAADKHDVAMVFTGRRHFKH